jgi:geranylgeranyl diphosphate synthase type II
MSPGAYEASNPEAPSGLAANVPPERHVAAGGTFAGDEFERYLAACRETVLEEIRSFLPANPRYREILYDLMLEYPLRNAKALRPAICIATCRAFGGSLEAVGRSAATLEFYHNAFLIHDDVEDGSEKRRDGPALHRMVGAPIAINVGDAMLALALDPLLDNVRLLGLGKALRIFRTVAGMARESAEGQAIELSWLRDGRWDQRDSDYLRMVHKKTSVYTFLTPVTVGAIAADCPPSVLHRLRLFATSLGLAFQIQDDILNVTGDERTYGKEAEGDLWEGKRTLVLLHAIRCASEVEQRQAAAILAKPRRPADRSAGAEAPGRWKTGADVQFLASLIARHQSVAYARRVATRRAERASKTLRSIAAGVPSSPHLRFLERLTGYVATRER